MLKDTGITLNETLSSYFHVRLKELGQLQNTPPNDDTLRYVGDMLVRFSASDQLFSYEQYGYDVRPLAFLYKDAHETNDLNERCLILRQLGDTALFIGALFPEKYQRRGIQQDYFVGMGGGAYSYLSEKGLRNRHVFSELAASFTPILELVAEVCAKQTSFDNSDILALYQRWQKNNDPNIARKLRALGITLLDTSALH
tara:strand:- start:1394 stop:1990 length:597 start_codon:yes stop_codon:yes gene_type:complete